MKEIDEQTFTVSTPVNFENDRLYSTELKKREGEESRLVCEREHCSRNIMISVELSRMGKTSVVFVEPGAKVNSEYYCDHVRIQGLLRDIQAKCGRYTWTL